MGSGVQSCRYLGSLATAGLTRNQDDLVIEDSVQNLVLGIPTLHMQLSIHSCKVFVAARYSQLQGIHNCKVFTTARYS